jgi:Zn-dependent peptidase ImmA (M78 family)
MEGPAFQESVPEYPTFTLSVQQRQTDTYRVPVQIDKVARALNLTMQAAPLGERVSGVLLVEGDRGAIGYNLAHSWVRRRFTISREIAHFLLHAKKSAKEELFIDSCVRFRPDKNLSASADRKEVEANQLGAALLMPKGLVQEEIRRRNLDLDDEEAIRMLAKEFFVSEPALAIRLVGLGILR